MNILVFTFISRFEILSVLRVNYLQKVNTKYVGHRNQTVLIQSQMYVLAYFNSVEYRKTTNLIMDAILENN